MPPTFLIEGIGDVTSDVIYGEGGTQLQIAANGEARVSQIILRDLGPTIRRFVTGKRITVHVEHDAGPDVVWAGFLGKASRQFWYDVDKPDTLHRRWVLTTIDLNILFGKRVVFKGSDPAHVPGPVYVSATYDDTIIAELLAHWLDLSADDLDTTSLVDRVAIVNPSTTCATGQAFRPWNASMLWGEAMDSIAQIPGAIYALLPGQPLGSAPFGRLMYADVDTGVAPYILSDRPDLDPGSIGYREATIFDDATNLVNDALCWGFGKGTNQPVFSRVASSSSIAAHGIWQQGQTLVDVWCKDTIDAAADSIVFGSPSSHRGQKDDLRLVDLTVNLPISSGVLGFKVAQRARFISHEYGVDQVLPIRSLELDFPTGSDVRYKMKLGHAYDRWGFSDPMPPFGGYGGGGDGIGGIGSGVLGFGICGVFENFNRVVAPGGWNDTTGGTPPASHWVAHSGAAGLSVDGAAGHLISVGSRVEADIVGSGLWSHGSYGITIPFTVRDAPRLASFLVSAKTTDLQFRFGTADEVLIQMAATAGPPITGIAKSYIAIGSAVTFIPPAFWTAGGAYQLTLELGGGTLTAVISDGSTAYTVSNSVAAVEGVMIASTSDDNDVALGEIVFQCGFGFLPAGDCGNPGDVITEIPTRLGGNVVQTHCGYQPNFIRVIRNGILQVGEGIDYTQTDSSTGLITFVSLLDTDAISVIYLSEGS